MSLKPASERPWTRGDSLWAAVSLFLAVAPVVFIAIEWAVAWLCLGRPPVPSLDDPSRIEGLPAFLGILSGIALLGLPITLIALPLAWLIRCGETRQGKMLAGFILVLALSSVAILRSDPLGIVSWWFD